MRPTVRLGRIGGVPVGVNAGVLVIVALIAISLALGQFPARYPDRSPVLYVIAGLVVAVLFIASILLHELAHSWVARAGGLEVEGITLWLLGGVSQLRGEARSPKTEGTVAIVGPATSVLLGVAFGVIAVLLNAVGLAGLAVGSAWYLAAANLVLAIFNLLPAAPLDGGRVLRAALWQATGDRVRAIVISARAGRAVGFLLIVLGIVQVFALGGFGGLWLALIGWFLVHAASAEEQSARIGQKLHAVRVGDVMTPNPVTVPASETVDRFIRDQVLHHRFSTYPMVDESGRLTGLVTLNRIRRVPAADRATTTLAAIACPPAEVPTAYPGEPLVELLPRLAGCTDGRAVAVDEAGRVVGLVSPSDVSRVLAVADLIASDPYPPRGADLHASGSRTTRQF